MGCISSKHVLDDDEPKNQLITVHTTDANAKANGAGDAHPVATSAPSQATTLANKKPDETQAVPKPPPQGSDPEPIMTAPLTAAGQTSSSNGNLGADNKKGLAAISAESTAPEAIDIDTILQDLDEEDEEAVDVLLHNNHAQQEHEYDTFSMGSSSHEDQETSIFDPMLIQGVEEDLLKEMQEGVPDQSELSAEEETYEEHIMRGQEELGKSTGDDEVLFDPELISSLEEELKGHTSTTWAPMLENDPEAIDPVQVSQKLHVLTRDGSVVEREQDLFSPITGTVHVRRSIDRELSLPTVNEKERDEDAAFWDAEDNPKDDHEAEQFHDAEDEAKASNIASPTDSEVFTADATLAPSVMSRDTQKPDEGPGKDQELLDTRDGLPAQSSINGSNSAPIAGDTHLVDKASGEPMDNGAHGSASTLLLLEAEGRGQDESMPTPSVVSSGEEIKEGLPLGIQAEKQVSQTAASGQTSKASAKRKILEKLESYKVAVEASHGNNSPMSKKPQLSEGEDRNTISPGVVSRVRDTWERSLSTKGEKTTTPENDTFEVAGDGPHKPSPSAPNDVGGAQTVQSVDEAENHAGEDPVNPESELKAEPEALSEAEPEQKQESMPDDPTKVKELTEAGRMAFAAFEQRCPPGGEDAIVLYVTSVRAVRKTFDDCGKLRTILQGTKVLFEERDVSHAKYKAELKELMGRASSAPQVFIRGYYIGDGETVVNMHEDHFLEDLFEGIPRQDLQHETKCKVCSGRKLVTCKVCNGNHKVVGSDGLTECKQCNEEGMVPCSNC